MTNHLTQGVGSLPPLHVRTQRRKGGREAEKEGKNERRKKEEKGKQGQTHVVPASHLGMRKAPWMKSWGELFRC